MIISTLPLWLLLIFKQTDGDGDAGTSMPLLLQYIADNLYSFLLNSQHVSESVLN